MRSRLSGLPTRMLAASRAPAHVSVDIDDEADLRRRFICTCGDAVDTAGSVRSVPRLTWRRSLAQALSALHGAQEERCAVACANLGVAERCSCPINEALSLGGTHVQSHQERHHRHRRPHLEGRRADQARQDHRDRAGPARRPRVRRHRLLRDAGRHRSAHPSRNAVHGHLFGRRFRERHARGAVRRHHDGGRFLPAVARPVAARSAADVGQQDLARPAPTIPSTWRSPGGASRCSTRWPTSSTRASPRSSTSWPTRAR